MKNLFIFLVATLFLVGCKSDNKEQKSYSDRLDELKSKRDFYLEQTVTTQDQDGWIEAKKCDALLHNALYSVGGGTDYQNLFKARDDSGQWFRRPAADCLSSGGSKSTISRDMLLGLMIAILANRDLEAIDALVKYGEDNDFKMGENDGSLDGKNRVRATPSFQSLMYQVRANLGGQPNDKQKIPQDFTPFKKGFERHLAGLTILLRGLMRGGIDQIEQNTIRDYVKDDPNNALFWAIRNTFQEDDQAEAIGILLRQDLFPVDRLPTSSDRCNAYLWMHGEKPSDWDPCDKGETHPAHDFLFATWVIERNSVRID